MYLLHAGELAGDCVCGPLSLKTGSDRFGGGRGNVRNCVACSSRGGLPREQETAKVDSALMRCFSSHMLIGTQT